MNPYRKPLLYWISAIAGLVIALLSDGFGDALGLTLLTLPIIPLVRAVGFRRAR